MYAIYGSSSSSPAMVQPPSLDEYLQFQAWREEKRQYQVYRQRCLQMERQRQRQRIAAALEQQQQQQRQEEEQRRKQQHQRSLDQRRMMAYLEHIRQQQELKRQRELAIQQQKAKEQEMARQNLMQQLYLQTQQEEQDDGDMDWTVLVERLMTRLLQGDEMDTKDDSDDDDVEVEQDQASDDDDDDADSDSDELLMVLTEDAPKDEMTTDGQQGAESGSDSDDEELVMVLTNDVTASNDDTLVTNTDDDMDNKKALKLETLKKIKEQLDDIHASHQRILTSSLYFNDNNDVGQQHHDDDDDITANTTTTIIQVPTISKNHDFLQYEDNIMRILLQLDDISSEGDDLIRQERKDLVKQAGSILDQLDQHKQTEWERHSSATASSVGSESDNDNHDDDDNDNYDMTDHSAALIDHSIIKGSLANDTTHDHDDNKDSLVASDKDNDMIYELMQDVDGDGFLILNM